MLASASMAWAALSKIWRPGRGRARSSQEPIASASASPPRIPANLAHLTEQALEAVGVLVGLDRPAEHDREQHHGGLCDVGAGVASRRHGPVGHRDTELVPETCVAELELLDELAEGELAQDQASPRREQDARGAERAVGDAAQALERDERRQDLVGEIDGDGDVGHDAARLRARQQLVEPLALDVRRDDEQARVGALAGHALEPDQVRVRHRREALHHGFDHRTEGRELGPHAQHLELLAARAVEPQHPVAETVPDARVHEGDVLEFDHRSRVRAARRMRARRPW